MPLDRSPIKVDKSNKDTMYHKKDTSVLDSSNTMEESETCLKCQRRVLDKGIECDSCIRWFHCSCVKISNEESKMIQKLDPKTKWFCENCTNDIKTLKEQIKIWKFDFSELAKENVNLKETINNMDSKMEEFKNMIIEENRSLLESKLE